MKRSMLLAVLVVVILVVAVGGYLAVSSIGKSSTSGSPSVNGVRIASDTLVVNPSAGTGTWTISVENTGSLNVTIVTADIGTTPSMLLCSGSSSSSGLYYKNCPAINGNPLPPSQTVEGSSTGTGASSATPGTSYPVSVHVYFQGGQDVWLNSTVTAQSG
jgi:hypothetical protein